MSARRFGPIPLILMLLVGVAGGLAGARYALRGDDPDAEPASAAPTVLYQCPMHPSITSDHPADCPICGMKLVAKEVAGPGEQRRVAFYRSPMDPKQTSPVPRKDEMGMDYIPVHEDELGDGGPSGLATVHIDPSRQQLIGLRTAPVQLSRIGGSWRTVGRVAFDETRVHHVSVRIDGYVREIFADFVGKPVRKGEPLFSLYSPELLSLQKEYVLALKLSADLAGGPLEGGGEDLVAAARERFRLWDVPPEVRARLDQGGAPQDTIVLAAPMSGVITAKDVVAGHYLEAGDAPYEISDLSQVWVLIDVHESDLARTEVGMEATFVPKAFPNEVLDGRVAFIDPSLNPETRTVRARLTFTNPHGRLLPEMFGDVIMRGDPKEGLTIPADAVIDSGVRKVVFVSLGDGKFEPREVHVGAADEGTMEVLDGLVAGENVVVRANFLVDSESRLRASLAAVSTGAP